MGKQPSTNTKRVVGLERVGGVVWHGRGGKGWKRDQKYKEYQGMTCSFPYLSSLCTPPCVVSQPFDPDPDHN